MTRKTVRRVGSRRLRTGGGVAGGGEETGGSVDIRRGRQVQWGCRSGPAENPGGDDVGQVGECEPGLVESLLSTELRQIAAKFAIPLVNRRTATHPRYAGFGTQPVPDAQDRRFGVIAIAMDVVTGDVRQILLIPILFRVEDQERLVRMRAAVRLAAEIDSE